MTWRRLSRNLLIGSLVLLAAAWVTTWMFRTWWIVTSPTRVRGVAIHSASINIFSLPQQEPGAGVDSFFQFHRFPNAPGHPLGRLDYNETPVQRQADPGTGPPVPGTPQSAVVEDKMWSLQVPVWALWFPFAGCCIRLLPLHGEAPGIRRGEGTGGTRYF